MRKETKSNDKKSFEKNSKFNDRNSGKRKNGKRNFKGDDKDRKSDRDSDMNYKDWKSNPIEWYNRYPQLLEAAGRIPFPYRPGMLVNLGTIGARTASPTQVNTHIPGACVLNYVPTVGQSSGSISPISQVAREIYGKVRAAFSSELAVGPADFVMYLMALDSIFSNIGFLKRIYRIVNTYSPDNYAMPDLLLRSMGFSTTQIQRN